MKDILLTALPVWLGVTGLITLAAYGIDKRRAKKHKWRIKESTLFILNLLGGFIGGWCGMFLFRHKTKHASFYLVQGLAAAVWIGIAALLIIFA